MRGLDAGCGSFAVPSFHPVKRGSGIAIEAGKIPTPHPPTTEQAFEFDLAGARPRMGLVRARVRSRVRARGRSVHVVIKC